MITLFLGALTGFVTMSLFENKKFQDGGVLPIGSEVVFTQGQNRPLMKGKVLEYVDDEFYFVNIGTDKAPKAKMVSKYRILN